MKLTIKPYGEISVDIVKEFEDGSFVYTSAIRYEHNHIIAYENPHVLSLKDIRDVERWYKDNHPIREAYIDRKDMDTVCAYEGEHNESNYCDGVHTWVYATAE